MRDLFKQAQLQAPCIVFIDELAATNRPEILDSVLLLAVRKGREKGRMEDLNDAVERVIAGRLSSRKNTAPRRPRLSTKR